MPFAQGVPSESTTVAVTAVCAKAPGTDLLAFLKDGVVAAASATVGTSALESRKIGYLLDSDIVVPHKDELLHVA